jgi:hypothetical protein
VLAGGCTTSVYVSSYSGVYCCYTCVRILLCPHTTVSAYYCVLILVYMSSYSGVYCCYTCVRILLCPYTTMCPHTSICVLVLRCVLLLYMCVVKQVYMCPHTTAIHVSAYYCVRILLCVLILVYVSSYSGVYCCYACVPHTTVCPHTTICPHTSMRRGADDGLGPPSVSTGHLK